MTAVHKEGSKTVFKSPDEMVSHIIQGEELVAVCPGTITVEPVPKEATETRDSTGKKKNNVVYTIIILVLFAILATLLPDLVHHGVELILIIIILPFLFMGFAIGLRIGQNALILTKDNAWVIFGMIYDKKTNTYGYNITLCTPRTEVTRHSWSKTLSTLTLKIPGHYEVKISQGKMYNKTKYYKEKVIDLVDLEKMIP